MELWERAEALSLLRDLLRDTERGGRVAIVAGEAGIGKSVLVTEFTRRCGAAARVLWGACDPLVTPRALGPLHDISRMTGGPLAERLRAGATQQEIFAAFLDEITGPVQRARPVIVVEDAHWADEATLDWLALLGRRIARLSALLIVTFRDDEVGARHPLRGTLAALPSSVVRRVPVPPLSPECVAEQARHAGHDAQVVRQLAGGNPLLVTELIKSGGRAAPASVADLILDRLRALAEPARELAELVAVVPTRAEAVIVADAPRQADACVDAGVLVPAGDGLSYRHELLRSAVEGSLLPARRAELHGRALGLLAAAGGADPGRLVHHARNARDDEAVLRYGQVAGADAARQGAHREAAAHYAAAAEHARLLPPGERAELLEAYAFQAYLAGRSDDGLRARQAALGVRESLGQPQRVGENLRWISRLSWWTGRAGQARDAAARAVTILEREPPGRELAMAYSNRSQLHMLAEEHDAAIEWGQRARALVGQLGDAETALHAAINVATARCLTGDAGAPAELASIHAEAAAAGLVDHAGRALVNLAWSAAQAEEIAVASPLTDRALRYAAEHDLDGYSQYMLGARADLRVAQGRWAGALADADAALARPTRIGVAVVPALLARGRIQAARGEPEAAATLAEASRQAEETGELQRIGPVAAARSEFFLWCGDAERAAAEARRGLDLAIRIGHPALTGLLAYRLWRAGGPATVPDAAAAQYRMMISGDWAGAAAEWERRGHQYARAEALGLGDEAAAAEALRILDSLGAAQAARALRAGLRERGISRVPRGPRRATAANAAGLTPRQADVLALLAEGLTNAEIAERLSLSAKTVDHHVSAVLGKLGVASRGQAVAAAHKLDAPGGRES